MIYFLIFSVSVFLYLKNVYSTKRKDANVAYFFLYFILVLLCALRYRVGGDTLQYFDTFDSYPIFDKNFKLDFADSEYNIGWNLFNSTVKTMYDSFYFFQFIHAIIVNGAIFYFIKKFSINKFFVVIFYLFFYFLYFNMEILRESLAIAMFLFAIPHLLAKNWVKYYLLCVLAYSFHSSAGILFIIPLFAMKIQIKYQIIILIILTIGINLISIENIATSLFSSSELAQKAVRNYIILEMNTTGIIFQLLKIIPVFIIMVISVNKKINHPLAIFITPYLVIGLLASMIPGVYRFLNYLALPILVFCVDVLYLFFRRKEKNILPYLQVSACMLFLVLIQLQYFSRDMSKVANRKGAIFFNIYTPYHSVFDEQEDTTRENIFYNSMNIEQ